MTDPAKRDRAGSPWSEDDILDLRDGYESGVDPSEIAEVLLRREDEVTAKAAELGLGASVTENAPPPVPLGN
jgi:hypothetical protein